MRPKTISDEDLLEVARRCFLSHGPAVSTQLIADEAGVSQSTLFKRFGSKSQLMIMALGQTSGVWGQLQTGPDPDQPLQPQLEGLMLAMVGFFRVVVPSFHILSASGNEAIRAHLGGPDSPPVRGRLAFTAWLEAAQAQGRLRPFPAGTIAVALIGMMQARPFREEILGDRFLKDDDATFVKQLTEMIMHGIHQGEP
jgi:AcrR family transcriptional regulator